MRTDTDMGHQFFETWALQPETRAFSHRQSKGDKNGLQVVFGAPNGDAHLAFYQ